MQPIEWARTFCPVFYFTPDSITYPVDIGFYCRHATLCNQKGETLLREGCVTPGVLLREGYNSATNYLQIDPEVHTGQPVALEHVPIYATVTDLGDELLLQYYVIYTWNPGYEICGKHVGDHDFDLEHMSLYVNKAKRKLKRVYFSAHGASQGLWCNPQDCTFDYNTNPPRLEVFVARGSHAHYPKPKTYWRIGCLANDTCRAGSSWSPFVILMDDHTDWNVTDVGFNARYSRAPGKRGFYRHETGKSTSWFKRLCCCCCF